MKVPIYADVLYRCGSCGNLMWSNWETKTAECRKKGCEREWVKIRLPVLEAEVVE